MKLKRKKLEAAVYTGPVAQCVGGRPWGKWIYTEETRIIGIQFQDQEVMTLLLGRASGKGLLDWLPTPNSHQLPSQHTHTRMYTSSCGIWRGLITSWDLGLWCQPGPTWCSSIQTTSLSLHLNLLVFVCSFLSSCLLKKPKLPFLCFVQWL